MKCLRSDAFVFVLCQKPPLHKPILLVSNMERRSARPTSPPSPLASLHPASQHFCTSSKCILSWQLSGEPRPCLLVLVPALALLRLARFSLRRVTALKRSWQFCAWVFRHASQCDVSVKHRKTTAFGAFAQKTQMKWWGRFLANVHRDPCVSDIYNASNQSYIPYATGVESDKIWVTVGHFISGSHGRLILANVRSVCTVIVSAPQYALRNETEGKYLTDQQAFEFTSPNREINPSHK